MIDIGSGAADYNTSAGVGLTVLDLANPANESGTITEVKVWFATAATAVKVGTFFGSSLNYTMRDSALLGDIDAGSEKTFSGLTISVEIGDIIGFYSPTGDIEGNDSGGSGICFISGDGFDGNSHLFTLINNSKLALYGTGNRDPVNVKQLMIY